MVLFFCMMCVIFRLCYWFVRVWVCRCLVVCCQLFVISVQGEKVCFWKVQCKVSVVWWCMMCCGWKVYRCLVFLKVVILGELRIILVCLVICKILFEVQFIKSKFVWLLSMMLFRVEKNRLLLKFGMVSMFVLLIWMKFGLLL